MSFLLAGQPRLGFSSFLFATGFALISPMISGAGCEKDSPVLGESPQETANDQSTSTSDTSAESTIIHALTSADPSAVTTDDELATAAADGINDDFGQACVTSVVNKNVVTYTLIDCIDRWGLSHISGTVVGTYTKTADGALAAELQGTGLTLNGGVGDWKATSVGTNLGLVRTIDVTTDWKGYTAENRATSRKGTYTAVLDVGELCVGLDGDWNTKIGLIAWDTAVQGFRICKDECPVDGGTVTWTSGMKSTVLSYDGTDTASWSNSDDKSGTLNLACGS
jgi:hypothetical protein